MYVVPLFQLDMYLANLAGAIACFILIVNYVNY